MSLTNEDKQWLAEQFTASEMRSTERLESAMEMLVNEIGNRADELNARLDRIERRLDRQAGLLQTGARQTVRFIRWSESTDVTLQEMQKQIIELQQRLRKLEGGQAA